LCFLLNGQRDEPVLDGFDHDIQADTEYAQLASLAGACNYVQRKLSAAT
jgi:hypothetical protein